MILALAPDVAARVAEIEAREGIPAVEFCHQAISVWSRLRTDAQRAGMGLCIIQSTIREIMKDRDAAAPQA
ncbi:hypothetical protein [Aureimonas sp. AU20]|uniref:hypothetical protein n=1 Tax=Aureimonas sp. AU20 TaxID=1349819 RepID=UPI00071EFAD3|nr:hypothetical protein [Aureimonas sp. AU20]ALN73066.1 hypothetical protein M673_10075 [Aureimonas sp. AU20]